MEMLKKALAAEKHDFAKQTFKQNLNHLTKEKTIFDAGRGWYSTVADEFHLDTHPVEHIVKNIRKEFPLLEFSCWSTEQIKAYFHHLQARFVTFIYSDWDTLTTLFAQIRHKYDNIYLNPKKEEVYKNFEIGEHTLVLRPTISEAPVNKNYATIEKILVDLYLEKDRLILINGSEYDRVFKNVIRPSRINISKLLRYSKRREVKDQILEKIY